MTVKPPEISEGQARFFDILIKAIGVSVALIGATSAWVQYLNNQREVGKLERSRLSRELVSQRIRLYGKINDCLMKISSTNPGDPEFESARSDFQKLRFSEVPMIASDEAYKHIADSSVMIRNLSGDQLLVRERSMLQARVSELSKLARLDERAVYYDLF